MKLSILDAIGRYKEIHSEYSAGSIDEAEATSRLEKLSKDCTDSGLVFAPKFADLFEHGEFETHPVSNSSGSEDDDYSSEYDDDYSSEY